MEDLLAGCPEANAWVRAQIAALRDDPRFAETYAGVLWIDTPGQDGVPIGGEDPAHIVNGINDAPWPLLDGHDPGKPVGSVVAAKKFTASSGRKFVAGIFGIHGTKAITFDELGIDVKRKPDRPPTVSVPPEDFGITLGRDVQAQDDELGKELISNAPVEVEHLRFSLNADVSALELIRIGLPYLVLAWNPFVASFASEAGKDTYKAVREWLKRVLHRAAEKREPAVCVESVQSDCVVRFMFRGNHVGVHNAAHAALPDAAADAANVIAVMQENNVPPVELIYEYDATNGWSPSLARLIDGRAVTKKGVLIALAKSRTGLSLGFKV